MATIYLTATTLDGFIADPNDSLDWLFSVPGSGGAEEMLGPFMSTVGALAMGSTTYAWILEHEQLLSKPEAWPYPTTPTWVFSSRDVPLVAGADIRVVRGDVAPVHAAMREAAGDGTVWLVGGGDLVGQFADAGLLDEIRASVAPVTLGAGRPLLPRRLMPDRLHLVSARATGQFAELRYRVSAA
jgi:dihydrofolate reductase